MSENISEDEDPESESVLGIVPHQVSYSDEMQYEVDLHNIRLL